MHFADLDAVTLDAYGTLVELDRPIERLEEALRRRGADASLDDVERGFRAEVEYYSQHKHEGRDDASLRELRTACARVFSETAGAELAADEFIGAIVQRALPGAHAGVARFRAHGLALAVVSNWDAALPEALAQAGFHFDVVVTSAGCGAAKPDPRPLLVALEQLGVEPARALHVGDSEPDEEAARAAGVAFRRFERW